MKKSSFSHCMLYQRQRITFALVTLAGLCLGLRYEDGMHKEALDICSRPNIGFSWGVGHGSRRQSSRCRCAGAGADPGTGRVTGWRRTAQGTVPRAGCAHATGNVSYEQGSQVARDTGPCWSRRVTRAASAVTSCELSCFRIRRASILHFCSLVSRRFLSWSNHLSTRPMHH